MVARPHPDHRGRYYDPSGLLHRGQLGLYSRRPALENLAGLCDEHEVRQVSVAMLRAGFLQDMEDPALDA